MDTPYSNRVYTEIWVFYVMIILDRSIQLSRIVVKLEHVGLFPVCIDTDTACSTVQSDQTPAFERFEAIPSSSSSSSASSKQSTLHRLMSYLLTNIGLGKDKCAGEPITMQKDQANP